MVGVITPTGKLSALTIDADLAMGAHAITINAGGLIDGKDVDEIENCITMPHLVNTDVEAITPTGDAPNPTRLNVDDALPVGFQNINEYVEFDLLKPYFINYYRIDVDDINHDDNGSFKITFWDGVGWVDWKTGISTISAIGGGGNFCAWTASTFIIARKMRLVCTAVDTRGAHANESRCFCLQLKREI